MYPHYPPITNGQSWHYKMLPVLERVRLRSERQGDCYVFLGQRTADGYGVVGVQGKRQMVHKVVWEDVNGPVPEGMQLDHKCKNEPCWNPEHLRLVTPRENVLFSDSPAAKNAVKTHCSRGHEFSPENTRVIYRKDRAHPERVCRECKRERRQEARARDALPAQVDEETGNVY